MPDALRRRIDLNCHDLRREFACTLLETPDTAMHDVQKFLGHGNITTASRYLESSPIRLKAVLARMEGKDAPKADDADDATDAECNVCTSFAQPGAAADSGASKTLS